MLSSHSPSPLSSPSESAGEDSTSNLSMDMRIIPGLPDSRGEYQKELLYNHYLPYADQLDDDSSTWLEQIKLNLSQAVLLRELRPGVVTWMSRLTAYVNLYGFKFSKEDHINFIKITWELFITPKMEPRLMEVFARVLVSLLKKRSLLTPDDLELDWRPLYDIYEDMSSHYASMNMKIYPQDFEKSLKLLIKLCRNYFPSTATGEILAEFRPYFCPHDGIMAKAVAYCALFLPTVFVSKNPSTGKWEKSSTPMYRAWLGEMMGFWHSCYNTPFWEGSLLSLLARVAEDNIGQVDWELETPIMFQRFMSSLGLPVYYKKLGVGLKMAVLSTSSISRWIVNTITVSSSTLQHLEVMMNAVNSYYHSTSEGRYSEKLVDFLAKLVSSFCSRLHKERYESPKKKNWIPPNPTEHLLSDQQVIRFCEIVKPAILNMAMSKRYIEHARNNLQVLASIRPDIFIPPLISKLSSSLETLTEPHKFTAAVKCLCSVSRSLVRPGPLYPEGPSHVINILFSVLPGIDCNDIKKTMIVFQLISIYARLVPLSDLSSFISAQSNMTSVEKKICQQSAKFESFVLEFMERCFSLIENSTLEHIRQEQASSDTQMSNEESSINMGIVSCFDSVLHQADEKIQISAINKLERYLKGRIFEPKIAGKIASGMIRTCAKISPHKVLPIFLPHVCSVLKICFSDTDLTSDQSLGDEIMFNLVLLSDLLCLPGCHLVPYIPLVEEVLQSALATQNKEGHMLALTILRHAMHSLSHPCLAERSKIVSTPSSFPLHDWGQPSDLTNLDMKWYIPGMPEFEQVTRLADIFLGEQVVRLEQFIAGENNMVKDEVYRCLKTISSIIIGCSCVLSPWTEEGAIYHNNTQVEYVPRNHVTTVPQSLDYRYKNQNTRKALVMLMSRLVDKMLKDREDDTKSLNAITIILKLVMFQHSISDESFEKHSKNFYQSKSKLEVKLYGSKKHIRAILLDRILLQHEKRLVENTHLSFTATHQIIFSLLVTLATSHYSKVRVQGQTVLTKALKSFPYSYHAILSQVIPYLSSTTTVSHEQFKGALYIILQNQLLVKHNWSLQCELWPALVTAQHSEKPSITALVKSITGYIHSVDNWTIHWPTIPSKVISLAGILCKFPPEEEKITSSLAALTKKGEENMMMYTKLVESLCLQVEKADLHWRHYNTSLTMLCAMLRHDVEFPVRATTIFTNNLIHDNILVRKASLHVIDCVLKQTKRPHPKIKVPDIQPHSTQAAVCANGDSVPNGKHGEGDSKGDGPVQPVPLLLVQPGERPDNHWVQYSTANRPLDQESYDKGNFLHKTHFGFYVWPEEELVYAPNSAQPKLDRTEEEMPDSEKIIFRFFSKEENVNKLIEFLSLENKKGHDHFDAERFGMFKALFRNFGDSFLSSFRVHIERLVCDHRESHQRAASELLAAIIRGSKHWPYSKVESLWAWVVPAIRQALTKVSPETQRDWGTCFATSSDSRDPNRLHWLMEVAMEEPIRSQGSFIDASRLYMLQGVVAQQRWRVGELLHRLLTFLKPFLNHPYHNVRSRLGAVLTNIFALDIFFESKGNASKTSPDEKEFVEEVFPGLQCLLEDSQTNSTEERDSALRLLQTLSKWISSSIASNLGPVKPHMFKFLPLLLGYEWYDSDPQIARDCQTSLSCLSRTLFNTSLLVPMMEVVKLTARAVSWKTRVSTLDFLQAVIFNNFMLLCSDELKHDKLRKEIVQLVLDSLKDDQIEVRVKAAQVLGGLVHCQFLSPPQYPAIIATFQETLAQQRKKEVSNFNSRQFMTVRHGAVLGLCAFVTAFPHTVPDFVPTLLVFLGDHLHDKQPIPATIKKSLQSFKRTHQDNWTEHKEAFTEDQLIDLTNLLVSPSYYA